ncbi:MAG: (Fe-S)-binding protein [Limnochordia bacterium]|jgi:glycolate oxidase iron-sulfur subunit
MEKELRRLLNKCVRCGTCRSECPILAEVGFEGASPRGLIFLLQGLLSGQVAAKKMADRVYNCLLCDACTAVCPSGVEITNLIRTSRMELGRIPAFGPLLKLALNMFLTRPTLVAAGSRLLWAYQRSGLDRALRNTGILQILPGDLGRAEHMLPPLSIRTARGMLPEVIPAVGKRRYRVGYFLGCATNLLYPQVAQALVRVLAANGCEVVIPKEMRCCGIPHLTYGLVDTYAELVQSNLQVFKEAKVDAIISDCASCTATLSQMGKQPLGCNADLPWDEAAKMAKRVWDFSAFLVDELGPNRIKRDLAGKVTYHDPCHLARGVHVTRQPRHLLGKLGLELVEMPNADVCCGAAGTFALAHYDLSMAILKKKIDGVGRTGAPLVATSCPACIMQLTAGVKAYGVPAKVIHPAELAAQAY